MLLNNPLGRAAARRPVDGRRPRGSCKKGVPIDRCADEIAFVPHQNPTHPPHQERIVSRMSLAIRPAAALKIAPNKPPRNASIRVTPQ